MVGRRQQRSGEDGRLPIPDWRLSDRELEVAEGLYLHDVERKALRQGPEYIQNASSALRKLTELSRMQAEHDEAVVRAAKARNNLVALQDGEETISMAQEENNGLKKRLMEYELALRKLQEENQMIRRQLENAIAAPASGNVHAASTR